MSKLNVDQKTIKDLLQSKGGIGAHKGFDGVQTAVVAEKAGFAFQSAFPVAEGGAKEKRQLEVGGDFAVSSEHGGAGF